MTYLIENNEDIIDFVEKSLKSTHLALDTEFFRRFTYRAKLCLIQVNNGTESVAIDPLSDALDLSPLLDLIYRPDILKIFHSGRQDLEIFFQMTGKIPTPIFDTQIAAMACDIDPQPSYEKIVKKFLGVTLDKSLQNQDWRTRPLRQDCLDYALCDVIHLLPLYQILQSKIEAQDRVQWIADELDQLQNPKNYLPDFENLWQNIRGVKKPSPKKLALLKETAILREQLAIKYNVPRKHIIKDDDLLALAEVPPPSLEKFMQKNMLTMKKITSSDCADFFASIQRAQSKENIAAMQNLPVSPMLNVKQQMVLEFLRLIRKNTALNLGIVPKLFCHADELECTARDTELPESLTSGWRYQELGKPIAAFLKGELSLSMKDGTVSLHKIP